MDAERQQIYDEIQRNLWDDQYEPRVHLQWATYVVIIPINKGYPVSVDVAVMDDESAWVQDTSDWFGRKAYNMGWGSKKEIYDWLVEWELLELRRVGTSHDDQEYFATTKLTGE